MIGILEKFVRKKIRETLIDWPMDFGLETAVMNNVSGDYHEFGVFKGRSFIRNVRSFYSLLKPEDAAVMKFWAYDSFEGLPETHDEYAPSHFSKGAFSASRAEFLANVERAGIDRKQVDVVAGFYDQSLTPEAATRIFSQRKILMTYIDCDIYESAVPIFNFITSGLQVGSVIVIDDWVRHHCHPSHGMQRAFNEWLECNSNIKVSQLALSKRIAFVVYAV